MTHEFKKIVESYQKAKESGLKSVMATVVDLDGSSYRKPGVRMLIIENGEMTGAVSGGCVEKEILKQSVTVFKTGMPKVMTYDGHYRLGCEGLLYILLEIFDPETSFISAFENSLKEHKTYKIKSYYENQIGVNANYGSTVLFDETQEFSFCRSKKLSKNPTFKVFTQILKPCFRLVIIGAEHDAVALCSIAASLGWEVIIVASLSDPKTVANFPEAQQLLHASPETIDEGIITVETALVLMTHNYAKDLHFLIALKDKTPGYIGILGSVKRREKLLDALMENDPFINTAFLEKIHSPAGLNIGAITPQEIALSICAEILAVTRKRDPGSLRNTLGSINTDNYLN